MSECQSESNSTALEWTSAIEWSRMIQAREHPLGTMKARMGATHFLTKTLPKVAAERGSCLSGACTERRSALGGEYVRQSCSISSEWSSEVLCHLWWEVWSNQVLLLANCFVFKEVQ
jgi:hypothetical protein